MELAGKVALVTGGAQGIGKAFCRRLALASSTVVICDINEREGKQLELELTKEARKCLYLLCDVTNFSQLEGCFKRTILEFGKLDIVVNNAGIINDSEDFWQKEIDINLGGVVRGSQLGLRYLSQGGVVVAISSLAGVLRDSLYPVYSATKGAVNYFVRSLGSPTSYSHTGIRIIAIAPSLTDTTIVNQLSANTAFIPELNLLAKERAVNLYRQKPETVAECLIHVLENAESGSVWLVEKDDWRQIYYEKLMEM